MRRLLNTAFVVPCFVSLLAGCHTWRAEMASPAAVVDSLHPIQLRVTTMPRHRVVVWAPTVVSDSLRGSLSPGRQILDSADLSAGGALTNRNPASQEADGIRATVAIPLETVTRVETRHGNVFRTLGFIYLTVALPFGIAFAISNK